jgi:hypothetical protein
MIFEMPKLQNYLEPILRSKKTLSPKRKHAFDQSKFEESLRSFNLQNEEWNFVEDFLISIVESIQFNFPHNIFFDIDYLSFEVINQCKSTNTDFLEQLDLKRKKLISIFELFGKDSKIKFRYIHDFIYGFDWLKWMLEKRNPMENQSPYGNDFLNYISSRGAELVLLIDQNDVKYPDLMEEYRNPFLFSRTPIEEEKLHRVLQETDSLPISSWDIFAIPKFDKNYSSIRTQTAHSLGIAQNHQSGSHKI